MRNIVVIIAVAITLSSCVRTSKKEDVMNLNQEIKQKADEFVSFKLTSDLNVLSENEKKMLPLLVEAAKLMDDIFWKEAYGNKAELFVDSIDTETQKFLRINYGPWDRLDGDKPFIDGYGIKPAGANFYPKDMNKAEFEAWNNDTKTSLYTVIRRNSAGELESIPYHEIFKEEIKTVADLLLQASLLAEDKELKNYLEKRAQAILTDEYFESDMAWMEMKNNTIDFVIGPIESYEDKLYGYKAAHEAYILIKDKDWSERLVKYAALLPDLQRQLPTEQKYKDEMPGFDSDLNVYDAIYYAGDCNAGSKTIAINLPNDEKVREAKGSRKLQLKNSMQAKFDKILIPISDLLIAEDQRKHVTFDAFFENVMFHEVAHGLGLGNTVDKSLTVREALKETYTSLEEGKADILGLWCVYKLNDMGELGEKDMMDNFVTFMAGIFRSVRFGAASAHGKANMIRFNYFQDAGAFERDETTGTYRVNYEKMKEAMLSLSNEILKIQGDGDYNAANNLINEKGVIFETLDNDLKRIGNAGIPKDIVFEQGLDVLDL